MLDTFDHPGILLLAAVAALPALFPIVRFFFDDFETFKHEAGLHYDHDRALWILGIGRTDVYFGFKLLGIVASYGLLLLAIYQFVCRLLY